MRTSRDVLFLICVVFQRTSQTSWQCDRKLHFSNESKNSNFFNETMGKIEDDALRYSVILVIAFGVLGNILVIVSILRQKNMLNNNYYFLVLHLAICDLAALILRLFSTVKSYYLDQPLFDHSSMTACYVFAITNGIQLAGIGMMLIISFLRYRVTVHPLKPAISRRKWKVVCGLVYIVGLIVGGEIRLPLCLIKSNAVRVAYWKFFYGFTILFVYVGPTIFMAVVYCTIGRSLIKQNKHMKSVCSNVMRQHAPADFSFNIPRYIRNRRTFLVCVGTVLCYGIASIPMSLWLVCLVAGEDNFRMKNGWIWYNFAYVLKIAGSHSVNSLIYGILDKKLLTFWKCCCKKKRRTKEN